ncbi:MAG: hypothetical protein ACE5LU_26860 [Anaerolineae bacterium]
MKPSYDCCFYQLQNLGLPDIGDTAYDLMVMDYSTDESETGEFTGAQIHAFKHSSGGEKIVLAYMSIGEAEDYRFYWQSGWTPGNPAWLDGRKPGLARQLQSALLGSGLAGHHLGLHRPAAGRRLRRGIPGHH